MNLLVLLALAAPLNHAVVTTSDGARIEGEFSVTPGRKLELFDVNKRKWYRFESGEVARIAVSVEEEKLEQAWMFKEESDHTKLKLPYRYPLRKLSSAVTLTSGETLRGHVTFVFFIEKDDERQRFFVVAQQKGEKDQALEDLTYVKEVVFPGRPAGSAQTGTLKIEGLAAVVSVEREMSFQPPFTALLTGKYDVFMFSAAGVRYGLTGMPLKPEELQALQDKIGLVEEFYTGKRIVAARVEGKIGRALMELTRPEQSHDKGWKYARWECWTFEPAGKTWDIRKRLFLHRQRFAAAGELPAFEYVFEEQLCGREVAP